MAFRAETMLAMKGGGRPKRKPALRRQSKVWLGTDDRALYRSAQRAAAYAARKYGHLPNVVGVAAGVRLKKRKPTGELCVQFYVIRKQRLDSIERAVPSFLYGRTARGKADRSIRFPTDVIETGRPSATCGGGWKLKGEGGEGTVTLIFRNRAEHPRRKFYLVTCSHCVGDLSDSPPPRDELRVPACTGPGVFAVVTKCAVRNHSRLPYDVALGRLTREARAELGPDGLSAADGSVVGQEKKLERFIDGNDIRPGLEVDCRLADSSPESGQVLSFPGTVQVLYHGRSTAVDHAVTVSVPVSPGDSGGLVHAGTEAIGVVFARSPAGLAWFHPLEGAITYLAELEPRGELRCFS